MAVAGIDRARHDMGLDTRGLVGRIGAAVRPNFVPLCTRASMLNGFMGSPQSTATDDMFDLDVAFRIGLGEAATAIVTPAITNAIFAPCGRASGGCRSSLCEKMA